MVKVVPHMIAAIQVNAEGPFVENSLLLVVVLVIVCFINK